jgi:hypothetical protein
MPNLEETKKAERRRAAREARTEATARQARSDLERKPDDQAKARLAAVDQVHSGTHTPGILKEERIANRRQTKKEVRREAAIAADRQAKVDMLLKPEPMPDNYKPGDKIPLHILNQRAKQARVEARDEATEIAKEVGLFTRDQIMTRAPRSVARSKRMRDAVDAMQKAKVEAAAKKG